MNQSQQTPEQPEQDNAAETQAEDDSPKFGRLLLLLLFAVALVVVITFTSEYYYSN
jgi:hypothetical protein